MDELEDSREDEFCIPSDENDILITGDFNANRFDNRIEQFWDDMAPPSTQHEYFERRISRR